MRLVTLLLLVSGLASLDAQESKKKPYTITDPTEAAKDADFLIQGEYQGKIQGEGGELEALGVQVVALGGGRFKAYGYSGGLPGAGWKAPERGKAPERIEADGTRNPDGVTVFNAGPEHGSAVIDKPGGKIKVLAPDGQVVGSLERVVRKSVSLGAKPPKGAVVLFDGTSTKHFVRNGQAKDPKKRGEAQMTQEGHLKPRADSADSYGSGRWHVEFRTPFRPFSGPASQDRGNSGVYLQSRFEVQILDSFAQLPRDNLCGGVYSMRKTKTSPGGAPRWNLCYPPLSWQTYDIEFRAAEFEGDKLTRHARMSVWHNGVLIHEWLELDHTTTASPIRGDLGPKPGPLHLQDHGNPVLYRNIWFVPLKK